MSTDDLILSDLRNQGYLGTVQPLSLYRVILRFPHAEFHGTVTAERFIVDHS